MRAGVGSTRSVTASMAAGGGFDSRSSSTSVLKRARVFHRRRQLEPACPDRAGDQLELDVQDGGGASPSFEMLAERIAQPARARTTAARALRWATRAPAWLQTARLRPAAPAAPGLRHAPAPASRGPSAPRRAARSGAGSAARSPSVRSPHRRNTSSRSDTGVVPAAAAGLDDLLHGRGAIEPRRRPESRVGTPLAGSSPSRHGSSAIGNAASASAVSARRDDGEPGTRVRQEPRRRARRGHRDVRFEPGLRQRAPQFLADGARLAKQPFEPVQIDGQRVRFHPGHTRREPLARPRAAPWRAWQWCRPTARAARRRSRFVSYQPPSHGAGEVSHRDTEHTEVLGGMPQRPQRTQRHEFVAYTHVDLQESHEFKRARFSEAS